eukprot:CAMPEP_0174915888 /NCGR_PEP_ID=MMETSP1355-20121228/1437_1 /TAXON_ID=464990 /ORGANISM="Hemiselmis tepida, Strain CCMP443" /LENGTH=73 /DNA_ID=CAMNT_0016160837 /DNA_START=269 /DNA_END=490 /DNA_ORIENTATION=+
MGSGGVSRRTGQEAGQPSSESVAAARNSTPARQRGHPGAQTVATVPSREPAGAGHVDPHTARASWDPLSVPQP